MPTDLPRFESNERVDLTDFRYTVFTVDAHVNSVFSSPTCHRYQSVSV